MRILIFIALLCAAVQGRGQMYINSYAFGAADLLLLDSFSGATVAYSLRKLDKDYAGNCITVRRENNDTSDIGFSNNYLDTVAMKTFCGTTSSDTCTIRRWYDQSGNGRNIVQTTDAFQPTIISGGIILMQGIRPTVRFNGINNVLTRSDAGFPSGSSARSVFSVKTSTATGDRHFFSYGTAVQHQAFFLGQITSNNRVGFFQNNFDGTSNAGYQLLSTIYESTTLNQFKNNATDITGSVSNVNTQLGGTFYIGDLLNLNLFFQGNIQEIILYPSNQSTDRVTIQNNINKFYSIY